MSFTCDATIVLGALYLAGVVEFARMCNLAPLAAEDENVSPYTDRLYRA